MMTSSVFVAKQHISKWSSALAVQTRRHRKKKPRDPKCLARSACQYLQPTRVRMVTTLPTESQRYRGNGVLRESQLFAKKNDNQTDNLTTKLRLSILAKMTTEQSVWLSVWRSPTVTDNQTDNQTRQQIDF